MKQIIKKLSQVKLGKQNLIIKYTIIFFVVLIIGLIPIEIKNKSFLFSGLFSDRKAGIDGLKQHLIFMYDFISYIKTNLFSGQVGLYRFDIGLGSDMLIHYSYYSLFDPILIIAYIIPLKYIEFSYYLIIIVRLYSSGLAIIVLIKKLGIKNHSAILASSIFYAFSVAILFSAFRHPMFVNGPMYFALIIYGYEKVKNGESEIPLIIYTFLALITQFYIFIYTTFGFILYTLIDLIREKKIKLYVKVNLFYFVGVLLAGFILTTQLYATLNGARIASKGLRLYDTIDYAVILLSNFLPLAGDHYTAGIGNLFTFLCVVTYTKNEKKKSTVSIFFITLFVLSLFSSFSYLINLGSYVVNRWMYLITLPSSIILAKYLDSINKVDDKSYVFTIKLTLVIFIISLSNLLVFLVTLLSISKLYIYLISLLIVIIGLALSILVIKGKVTGIRLAKILKSDYLYKYVIYNSIIVLFVVSVIYCFILTPNNALKTYYGNQNLYQDAFTYDGFYRVESSSFVGNVEDYSNDWIYYNYPSTISYNTMTNGEIINLLEEYNIINNNNSVGYNGFNYRAPFMAINHVKYVVIRESEKKMIPYGFSYYKTIKVAKYDNNKKIYHPNGNILKDENGNIIYEDAYIYINDLFLNFGVIFDTYLSYEDVKHLSPLEKEMLLTKTIIIDSEDSEVTKFSNFSEIQKEVVSTYTLINSSLEDGFINVKQAGKISFTIPNVINSDVYLEVKGLTNVDKDATFRVLYKNQMHEWLIKNYGYASNMYMENKDHLVYMGYYENESNMVIEIELDEGLYSLEEINYYLISREEFESDIIKLNNNSLKEVEFGKDYIKGKIKTNSKGYLLISIPYSKGFKAYVDGKEAKIYKANTGYMAIYVDKKTKNFELKYKTPALEIGEVLSTVGFVTFVFLLRNRLISSNPKKDEELNENYS